MKHSSLPMLQAIADAYPDLTVHDLCIRLRVSDGASTVPDSPAPNETPHAATARRLRHQLASLLWLAWHADDVPGVVAALRGVS